MKKKTNITFNSAHLLNSIELNYTY